MKKLLKKAKRSRTTQRLRQLLDRATGFTMDWRRQDWVQSRSFNPFRSG
ncbi:hypothetical protein [Bradyrhizobium sp. WSM2793]|nr:hypothetical protein [Bradyrhizobium sp. WSM2793]